MDTTNNIIGRSCRIRKGYRYAIIDVSGVVVCSADFKSLDDALIDLGKSIHYLRTYRRLLIIREELYYIEKYHVAGLKKIYHF